VDRLATFLVEKAMECLPFLSTIVSTPVGVESTGKVLDAKVRAGSAFGLTVHVKLMFQYICGVTVLRSYVLSCP
jgi:hypothetical protein